MANTSWNVSKAVFALNHNAQAKSSGKCAKYVRMAIEAGGISTAGRPVSAYLYKGFLPKIGFNFVTKVYGRELQRRWSGEQAQTGDIAVMDHGKHGHICMWNGSKWISDFYQNNMWVYSGDGLCYLYRFNGLMDKTTDWNQYTPPAFEPQSNIPSNNSSGLNVYSGPIENASSITTDLNLGNGDGDEKRTRIYAATKPTIVVDDLYMAMLPKDAKPDTENENQTNS